MNELDTLKRVLLCRPDQFQLLPINEMARSYLAQGHTVDAEVCAAEHDQLADAYRQVGVAVDFVSPDPKLRYQVFTRDPAVLTDLGLVLGQLREAARSGEEDAIRAALGNDVALAGTLTEADAYLEGGDVAYLNSSTVAVGVGARSNSAGASWLGRLLAPAGVEVVEVPFDPAHLHLDIIFVMVAPATALAVVELLPMGFVGRLQRLGFELLAVSAAEAHELLACNVVATGNDTVVSVAKNTRVNRNLRALGLKVLEPDLHQLLMGGGGPRCLTLPVERAVTDG